MEMTAESESVMAATLANGGVCPITGERVMRPGRNIIISLLDFQVQIECHCPS